LGRKKYTVRKEPLDAGAFCELKISLPKLKINDSNLKIKVSKLKTNACNLKRNDPGISKQEITGHQKTSPPEEIPLPMKTPPLLRKIVMILM
jgi:hypothetical protein